jgi:arabinofuranosyltransferase
MASPGNVTREVAMKLWLGKIVARLRNNAAIVGISVLAALILLIHSAYYFPFMADDAFISLRYSERLLEGQGLTWTAGERVEGYSNLLWVLGCAALGRLGFNLIVAARILGCATSIAAIAAVGYMFAPREGEPRRYLPAIFATNIIALTGIIAVWTIGGLEQPLLAALLAWAHAIAIRPTIAFPEWSRRRGRAVGILLGLVCWTRPEGFVFTGTLLIGLLVAAKLSGKSWRVVSRVALIPLAFVLAQLAFRLVYYGEWTSNTTFAKVSFTLARRLGGSKYLLNGLKGLTPALILAVPLIGALFTRAESIRRTVPLLASAVVWSVLVILGGGDVFPAHRHLVPLVVLLALLVGESTRFVCSFGITIRRLWLTAGLLGLTLLVGSQYYLLENRIGKYERWEWNAVPVGHMLRRQFEALNPVLAADASGSLVYFAHLPALDMLGLNDWYLAHNPPKTFGIGRLGHELGSGKYVLSRKPDLIVYIFPTGSYGSIWLSGREMLEDPQFTRDYRFVEFETEGSSGLSCQVWVRREGRAGIVRGRSVTVPGYLLAGEGGVAARLDGNRRMGAIIERIHPAKFDGLLLGRGHWSIVVHHSGEPIRVTATCGTASQIGEGSPMLLGSCDEPDSWSVMIEAKGEGLSHVRDLTFEPQLQES